MESSKLAYIENPLTGEMQYVKFEASSIDNSNQTRRWNRAAMCQQRIGLNLAANKKKKGNSVNGGGIERIRANRIKTTNQRNIMLDIQK